MKLIKLLNVLLQTLALSLGLNPLALNATNLGVEGTHEGIEHNTDIYVDKNGEMNQTYINLISQINNFTVKDILYSAHDISTRKMVYGLGKSFIPEDGSKKIGEIDCTHLIEKIFLRAGLPYEYVSTKQMVTKSIIAKRSFDYILPIAGTKNSFKPKTGDVLAYYNFKTKMGHAVMVIDPLKCIAINATTWAWIPKSDGAKYRPTRLNGVFFQEIKEGICEKGVWTSWGNKYNKFQVMLRHKEIVAAEPSMKVCPYDDANYCPYLKNTNLLIRSLMD